MSVIVDVVIVRGGGYMCGYKVVITTRTSLTGSSGWDIYHFCHTLSVHWLKSSTPSENHSSTYTAIQLYIGLQVALYRTRLVLGRMTAVEWLKLNISLKNHFRRWGRIYALRTVHWQSLF